MPWIHLEDAAAATALALEHEGPALYNIVDDESAPMSEWLPALASAVGGKRPFRMPTWLGNMVMGAEMVTMSLDSRGASNARAKRELGWTLRYPSWRQGFPASYGQHASGVNALA